MRSVDAGGVALRCELSGDAGRPAVVLLHEMGGTLESWDAVVPLIAPRFRVLRLDLRGAGLSEKVAGALSVGMLADDLLALLDALGLRGPVVVAGIAVGAAVALEFAARRPERCRGVIAMSPALGIPAEDRAARLAAIEPVLAHGMRRIAEAALGSGYPQRFRDRAPERFDSFRARWLGNDPESFVATYRMLAGLEMGAALRGIRCPVLGVCATQDGLRPPAAVRAALAPVAGVGFVEIDSCHHQATATPPAVAAAILGFMETLGAGE